MKGERTSADLPLVPCITERFACPSKFAFADRSIALFKPFVSGGDMREPFPRIICSPARKKSALGGCRWFSSIKNMIDRDAAWSIYAGLAPEIYFRLLCNLLFLFFLQTRLGRVRCPMTRSGCSLACIDAGIYFPVLTARTPVIFTRGGIARVDSTSDAHAHPEIRHRA